MDEPIDGKVLEDIQHSLKVEEMESYQNGMAKCACGCGRPKNMTKWGHRKIQQRYKNLRDEFFVRLLEEGASLEVAAFYLSENAQREAVLRAKQGQILNRKDIHDLGYYPTEVTSSGSLQRRALRRLADLPVELKKRVLEAAPKAIVRLYSLLDAKRHVYKDGVKVAEVPDNEVQLKSAINILDRTLGKPGETLKIEQEVRQFTVNVDASKKLDDDFASFLKQKYGKRQTEESPVGKIEVVLEKDKNAAI